MAQLNQAEDRDMGVRILGTIAGLIIGKGEGLRTSRLSETCHVCHSSICKISLFASFNTAFSIIAVVFCQNLVHHQFKLESSDFVSN